MLLQAVTSCHKLSDAVTGCHRLLHTSCDRLSQAATGCDRLRQAAHNIMVFTTLSAPLVHNIKVYIYSTFRSSCATQHSRHVCLPFFITSTYLQYFRLPFFRMSWYLQHSRHPFFTIPKSLQHFWVRCYVANIVKLAEAK